MTKKQKGRRKKVNFCEARYPRHRYSDIIKQSVIWTLSNYVVIERKLGVESDRHYVYARLFKETGQEEENSG